MSPGASQAEKAAAFRALHEGEPFLIPNPWDAGSARVLERSCRALSDARSPHEAARQRRDQRLAVAGDTPSARAAWRWLSPDSINRTKRRRPARPGALA